MNKGMKLRKFIVTTLREYLNEQQILNESFENIDMSKLLNLFIHDPVNFMEIFDIDNNQLLPQTKSIKLSLAIAKSKNDLIKNWNETHKNLKASIDGVDVSNELKELIYPSDIPKLINDTDNFLSLIKKRVQQRKTKASLNSDFTDPYGRISKTGLTPLKVINDFIENPKTNFNYSQYEYARADLDLQLINLIKNGDLKLKTTTIKSDNDIKSDLLNIYKNGLKGEELINTIDISSLRKFVNSFWLKNKKEIETKYNDVKNTSDNPMLVKIIDWLKK
jgi:hypothetical protein